MENLIIRKVEKNDLESVVDIKISSWQTAYKNIIDDNYLMSMNKYKELKKRQSDYMCNGFIVAELDGAIVGFCRYTDYNQYVNNIDCEIVSLYVKPNLKNNGIGSAMFKYVKNYFISKNKTRMILWCLKENFIGRSFYEKMGGSLASEKVYNINGKDYIEVSYIYELSNKSKYL